jgi:hypothetical protein
VTTVLEGDAPANAFPRRNANGRHRHRINRPQRENPEDRALIEMCPVSGADGARIATTRAQFAHFPGECLKPETRWRMKQSDANTYRRHFWQFLQPGGGVGGSVDELTGQSKRKIILPLALNAIFGSRRTCGSNDFINDFGLGVRNRFQTRRR